MDIVIKFSLDRDDDYIQCEVCKDRRLLEFIPDRNNDYIQCQDCQDGDYDYEIFRYDDTSIKYVISSYPKWKLSWYLHGKKKTVFFDDEYASGYHPEASIIGIVDKCLRDANTSFHLSSVTINDVNVDASLYHIVEYLFKNKISDNNNT